MPAVACDSVSQRCEWLDPLTQTKLKCILKFGNWFWLLLQLLLRLQHCPQTWYSSGLRLTRLGKLGPLIISDEVKAFWLGETRNLKRWKR